MDCRLQRDGRTPGGSGLQMLNIDLEEAHLTAEAEAVISLKKRHCVTAGITTSGSLGRSTATVRGEMRQALHCLLHDRGSAAVMRCLDTGPGPADAQAGAFGRFFWRGGYSRASFSVGSGLGLPIVGAIARAHGGDASNQYQRRTRRGSRAQEEGRTRGAA